MLSTTKYCLTPKSHLGYGTKKRSKLETVIRPVSFATSRGKLLEQSRKGELAGLGDHFCGILTQLPKFSAAVTMDREAKIAKLEKELVELKSSDQVTPPVSSNQDNVPKWGHFFLYVIIIGALSLFATSQQGGEDMLASIGKVIAVLVALTFCISLSMSISRSDYLRSKKLNPFFAGMTLKGFLIGLAIYIAAVVVNLGLANNGIASSRNQCLQNVAAAYTIDWNSACADYGMPNRCSLPTQVAKDLNNMRANLEAQCK